LPSDDKAANGQPMTIEEELMRRRKTCRFIEESGRLLKLPRVSIATAMVLFHRFYTKHAFQQQDRFEVAIACIVLAAKIEESPKKLMLVLEECYQLKLRGASTAANAQFQRKAGAASPIPPQASPIPPVDTKSEDFVKLKERVLLLERVILHTIGFELSIDHPYKFLGEIVQRLVMQQQALEYDKDATDKDASAATDSNKSKLMMNELIQYSMNFANDSLHTTLCLQFAPHTVATACVYLAGHVASVRPKPKENAATKTTWLTLLGIESRADYQALASISLQLIELITEKKNINVAIFDKIRKELDDNYYWKPSSTAAATAKSTPATSETLDSIKRPRTA
jgi:Cyclin, N-terminal domain